MYVFTSLSPGPQPLPPDAWPIADALVEASMLRAREVPALGSMALDLATMAVYVVRESGIHVAPKAESPDAQDGRSCGMLQLPCGFVGNHSLTDQAARWLQLARWGARICHEAPLAPLSSGSCRRGRKLSAERIALARAALEGYLDRTEEDD